jgi:hypothetical protein
MLRSRGLRWSKSDRQELGSSLSLKTDSCRPSVIRQRWNGSTVVVLQAVHGLSAAGRYVVEIPCQGIGNKEALFRPRENISIARLQK